MTSKSPTTTRTTTSTSTSTFMSAARTRTAARGVLSMAAVRPRMVLLVVAAAAAAVGVAAHPHHHDGPADDTVPIDSVLWIHMLVQAFTWIILFPLTMVLGLVRHRLHVPLSALSLLLTTGGYFLGHGHKGRSFPQSAHGTLASLMIFYLAAQTVLGIYLKLHLRWRLERFVRPTVLVVHGLLGRGFPVVGWVQCLFGVITLRSWCLGGHLGQCLAHHIMGSAFQGYAVIMLIMMKAAVGWLHRRGHSQEWFDSWVIFVWGWVNALTEHQGGKWTHKDLQHTMMGVLWIFGGAVGIWLSRGGRRSVFPGLMLIFTGWAMSSHAQVLMISTMVHALFGYVLMAAGLARIIEICFVLQDGPTGHIPPQPTRQRRRNAAVSAQTSHTEGEEEVGEGEEAEILPPDENNRLHSSHRDERTGAVRYERSAWFEVKTFQYLPPYLLTAAGMLFISATDEELRWADGQGVDAVTWGLIDFSISLGLFLWFNVLIDLYVSMGGYRGQAAGGPQSSILPSGQLEQGGGSARNGERGESDYVPLLSRRSESISATPIPPAGRIGANNAGPAKGPHRRGILANGRSSSTAAAASSQGDRTEKEAVLGNGNGAQAHVLFAESDEENDEEGEGEDPFDDEEGDSADRPRLLARR
ncbi:hypothetical protein A4X06_0g2330 [Tilletia controversa]|uniref:Protein YTP1-like C-terminal domain-containing protein n=1 Tax=Tilletia controversa TaxID=13291 RepID=A0A8X7SYV4_9BASI|nr:hypothetical protein CF328_g1856 [Tilletia controversa]KAE8252241.1 hypothetical protein A4X06_0g2330 [Tilletia controversa]